MTVRETNRWRGIAAMAFLAAGVGVIAQRPALLLASVVAIGFAAYVRSAAPPEVDLVVEHEIDDPEPAPGDEVTVTMVVRNENGVLADLRVFDAVPRSLEVIDGAARLATALPPGGEARVTYTVRAVRGEHRFGPATVVARDASGAFERETTVESDGAAIVCVPRLREVGAFPLRSLTTPHVGRVASRNAGPGVEFHSLRGYRPGDPLGRIAWRYLARHGDLATLLFHAERMATVVILVDVRAEAYAASPVEGVPHAVEHCVEAARRLLATMLEENNRVGVAALGPENCVLPPGLGRDHRARAEAFLATAEPLSPTPPDEPFYPHQLDELRKHLRGDVQVVWLSPLLDDYAAEVARKLESAGHAVTTVSPDVTVDGSTGRRLARAERRLRTAELREAGVRVVDWRPPEPLESAIARAARGWARGETVRRRPA